jgi:hypothetical protein
MKMADEQPAPQDSSPEERLTAYFAADAGKPQEQPEGQAEEASASDEQPQDQDAQQAEEQPAGDSDGYEEVDLDGETYRVPPKLKDAVLRQKDYTQKTQVLAEAQRLVQSHAQQLQMQRIFDERSAPIKTELQKVEAQLEQYKALDWSSMDTDTIVRARQSMDGLKEKAGELKSRLGVEWNQFSQAVSQSKSQMLQQGMEYLRRSIPKLDQGTISVIRQTAMNEGFTASEVDEMADARLVKVLWKASQYDALKANQKSAVEQVRKAPPVIKPGATQGQQSVGRSNYARARESLKKTGSVEAFEAALLASQRTR